MYKVHIVGHALQYPVTGSLEDAIDAAVATLRALRADLAIVIGPRGPAAIEYHYGARDPGAIW